jgi:hypothetical protein
MLLHTRPAAPQTQATHAARLCRMITTTCRPQTWRANGGAGTVEFHEIGGSLVVCNSPEVMKEVDALLASLRKEQECNVVVECQLISMTPGMVKLFDNPGMDGPGMTCLTDSQTRKFLTAIQADPQANVVQAPKVTLFNGQTARVSCGDLVTKMFTTGMTIDQQGVQTVSVPKQVTEQFGTDLKVQPTLSADRKYVRLAFVLNQRELAGPVELMPVTYTVRPVFEGGSQGTPIPFTQFLQQPSIVRRTVDRTVTLPDGGTVAVRVGTTTVEKRTEMGPPILSQVPYLNRLFKTVGISHEPREVVALLTTRVVSAGECETCPPVAANPACPAASGEGGPCCEQAKACCEQSKAESLVAAYRKACAAGKTEEALKLAMQALALDPKCFAPTVQPHPVSRALEVEIRR